MAFGVGGVKKQNGHRWKGDPVLLSGATRNAPLSRKTARGGSRGRFTANKREWTPRLLYNFPRATRERGPVAPAMHPFREKRVSRGGEPVFPRIKENGRHDFYVTLQRGSGIADWSAPQCVPLEKTPSRGRWVVSPRIKENGPHNFYATFQGLR